MFLTQTMPTLTLEAYTQAMEALQSFDPELIGRFVHIGPALTGEQRAEAVSRMQELHARLHINTTEAMRIYEEGIALEKRARAEYAPKFRKIEESSDRREDVSAADALIQAS